LDFLALTCSGKYCENAMAQPCGAPALNSNNHEITVQGFFDFLECRNPLARDGRHLRNCGLRESYALLLVQYDLSGSQWVGFLTRSRKEKKLNFVRVLLGFLEQF
jgi:hypothetical protein